MIFLLEKLRVKLFWFVDFLKGGNLKRHYKDVQFIMEQYDSDASKLKRDAHLDRLLKHATTTTPFYENLNNYSSLTDFPIVNKLFLVEKYEELQSKDYKNKANIKMSTSGSSGTPFTLQQDKNKKLRNTADTLYFAKQAGFNLGNRLYYFRKWSKKHQKNVLASFSTNIKMVNVTDFSDEYLAKFMDTFSKDPSHKAILGYSSALRDLCKYLDRINAEPINTNITSIIAMSEALSDYTRSALEKFFKKPVFSRYSNMENGMLAQQFLNKGDYFHINWASYHIELLHPDKDIPVSNGQLGRVVVTDLFNYCMPMIRYDTGDFAIMNTGDERFNKAPKFTKVEGRKMDVIFDTKGNPLSPFIVFQLEAFPELKQFQLIQEDQFNYTVKLNLEGTFHSEKELSQSLKIYLGNDAIITCKYVNEIPQLSSGKRRLTVNNYRQD